MKKIIIAIDGYSSCGKSSTAKQLAREIGYSYLDTGAMYRAVTLFFHNNYIRLTDGSDVEEALSQINISFKNKPDSGESEVYLNGLNVEKEIRKMHISQKVSHVSALAPVRKFLTEMQRKIGKSKGIVMDGRDIGTTVYPNAELKIFMTADVKIRAARRQKELLEKGQTVNLDEIIQNLEERDHIDATRKESPLRRAEDAVELDTSNLVFDNQVQFIKKIFESRVFA